MTRAAIYCRISRDKAGGGLGVATQETDCRSMAEDIGATVVKVYTDNDISAASGKRRPGYQAMLDDLNAGAIDVVIAWHTDRLHRRPTELEAYIEACEKRRVTTRTVKAGPLDLETPSGLMTARMLGAAARYEVDHGRERTKRAKQRAAENGEWRGGRRPFGYDADGVTVRPDEADAVAAGTKALLAGAPIRAVVREWNAAGLKSTTGQDWQHTSVRRTLTRARNAGLIERDGVVVGPAVWPAIVTEADWRALVDMLSSPSRRTNSANVARRWLGSGLYRCECGAPVTCSTSNGARAYRCRDLDGCRQMSRRQAPVDDVVSEAVVSRLREYDDHVMIEDLSGQRRALDVEAAGLRERLDTLSSLFADGDIDGRQLARGSRTLNDRLGAIHDELTGLHATDNLSAMLVKDDPGAAWLAAPLDVRRAVIDALMSVTLLRGGQGRPDGWQPGMPYFRPELVRIDWKG